MSIRRSLVHLLIVSSSFVAFCTQLGCGDDDCDAKKYCDRKTDSLITSGKIVPICGAETKSEGTTYSWQTEDGKCTCTLEQSIAGSFWRNCRFE